VALTATEFRILQCLAQRAGVVVTREEILDQALGRETTLAGRDSREAREGRDSRENRDGGAALDRTVDVHITSIRKKLAMAVPAALAQGANNGDNSPAAQIETVRGFGYKLRD